MHSIDGVNALDPINLNLLQTFHVVVRAGTVTAAAKELCRSQPAISHRLRSLERELGVQLFEKIGRRLQPTAQGKRLYAECVDLMARSAQLRERMRHEDDESGDVRIGTLPAIASHLLVAPIQELLEESPRIRLDFDFAYVEPICEKLRKGDLDFAVIIGEHTDPCLSFERLGATKLVAVFPRTALFAARKGTDAKRLRSSGLRFLAYGGQPDATFDVIEKYARKHELLEEHSPRIPHIESLRLLCARGAGYTLLPAYTVFRDQADGRVAIASIQGLNLSLPISLVKRHTSVPTPTLDAVERAIRTLASDL